MMKKNFWNRYSITGAGVLLALTIFYSQIVGGVVFIAAEVFTLGQADCRVWSESKPVMVCSSAPFFLHGKGGTQVGDTFVTSADRNVISNEVIEHEMVHKEQQRRYGLLFIPLYFSQSVINGCENSFEEEAGFAKGHYPECIGSEFYRN